MQYRTEQTSRTTGRSCWFSFISAFGLVSKWFQHMMLFLLFVITIIWRVDEIVIHSTSVGKFSLFYLHIQLLILHQSFNSAHSHVYKPTTLHFILDAFNLTISIPPHHVLIYLLPKFLLNSIERIKL